MTVSKLIIVSPPLIEGYSILTETVRKVIVSRFAMVTKSACHSIFTRAQFSRRHFCASTMHPEIFCDTTEVAIALLAQGIVEPIWCTLIALVSNEAGLAFTNSSFTTGHVS